MESLLAVTILGGALVPIMVLNMQSLDGVNAGEEMTHHLLGARAKMEALRATSFQTLAGGSDTYTICRTDTNGDKAPCGDADDETMTRTWTVTFNPESLFDGNLAQVDVTVGMVTLSTLLTRIEP